MRIITRVIVPTPLLAALLLAAPTFAQHEGHTGHAKMQDAAKAAASLGGPYPFATCPTSGKKLGAMGDPVVKLYGGREVRFCCGGCPKKFEKDLPASLAKLDAKVAADQGPLYPLKTSVVTGKNLPKHAVEFVYGNRLVRVGSAKEKATFVAHAAKFLGELDKAVVAAQGRDYPLKTCPISGEELGSMGEPIDRVIAGRLVRLCCKGCLKKLGKAPAAAVAAVDKARHGGKAHDGKAEPAKHGKHGK